MSGKRYITVILPLKIGWTPYYEIPADEKVCQGLWVRVNFANKEYSGIIHETDVTPGTETSKIKTVISVERQVAPVGHNEIRLWEMVSEYYLCTIGEVFKAAYPAMKISRQEALARMQEKDRERKRKNLDRLYLKARKTSERIEQKKKKLSETENSSKKREKLAAELKSGIADLEMELASIMKNISEEENPGGIFVEYDTFQTVRGISLTPGQNEVFEAALEAFKGMKPVLINGVTGSGKTEIYLELARRTMSEGRNVLYLVPEIAVSRQLKDRLQSVFGSRLMTFHSEETAASKRNTAEKIRTGASGGNRYIILGTRSALFLPYENLGLIIVDEEHDSSYKQDSPAPRYNGRDVAVMLARLHQCNIVLGSATPSLESIFNCSCGKYRMLTLRSRYYGADEAEVEIIDTASERRKNGMYGLFSLKLIEHMKAVLDRGEQILVFRSRRAFSPVLQCPGCGTIIRCPHCNVSLSYHKNPERMVCHHCGFTTTFNPACPKCGTMLQGLGSGTQKIEEEIRKLFPEARVSRLDSDTAKSSVPDIIRKFNRKETDILIGTQIITKSFDFPALSLAAAVSADSLLGIQDFRADEKALQILEQLRGRCGRRDRKGLFVIQTNQPDHPVYRKFAEGDATDLYGSLMAERREFGYPPYTRLINISVKDPDVGRCEAAATALSGILKSMLAEPSGENDIEPVSDPFSPPVDRIAGDHIRIIRVTLRKDKELLSRKKAIAGGIDGFIRKSRFKGQIILDVDPE